MLSTREFLTVFQAELSVTVFLSFALGPGHLNLAGVGQQACDVAVALGWC